MKYIFSDRYFIFYFDKYTKQVFVICNKKSDMFGIRGLLLLSVDTILSSQCWLIDWTLIINIPTQTNQQSSQWQPLTFHF